MRVPKVLCMAQEALNTEFKNLVCKRWYMVNEAALLFFDEDNLAQSLVEESADEGRLHDDGQGGGERAISARMDMGFHI